MNVKLTSAVFLMDAIAGLVTPSSVPPLPAVAIRGDAAQYLKEILGNDFPLPARAGRQEALCPTEESH